MPGQQIFTSQVLSFDLFLSTENIDQSGFCALSSLGDVKRTRFKEYGPIA